jgi:uncharacterized membrane protein YidH (DUF202 family)
MPFNCQIETAGDSRLGVTSFTLLRGCVSRTCLQIHKAEKSRSSSSSFSSLDFSGNSDYEDENDHEKDSVFGFWVWPTRPSAYGIHPLAGVSACEQDSADILTSFRGSMESKESTPSGPVSDYQKASERLAAERTFLAWIRTSIAVISLGFVVAKFGVWLRELADRLDPSAANTHRSSASLPIGVALMAVGGVFAILALWHYHAVNVAIERGTVRANRVMVVTVALAVALLALAVIIYLLATTENR